MNTLEIFYRMSGLKIIIDETKAICVGAMTGSPVKLCHKFILDWHQGNFEVL